MYVVLYTNSSQCRALRIYGAMAQSDLWSDCLCQKPENTAGGLDFEVQIEERPLKAVRLHSFIASKVHDFKANFAISC